PENYPKSVTIKRNERSRSSGTGGHVQTEWVVTMGRNMQALSCLVKNGDAHLKNFALLYEPDFTSVRLASAYDIVNTTTYIPNDQMVLTLAGSRRFPKEKTLIEFGQRQCRLSLQDAEARLECLKDSFRDTL
ncbi:hypothetical protein C9974_15265, partial [Marinobacter sp. B9-2]